jgi:hypothetical protein
LKQTFRFDFPRRGEGHGKLNIASVEQPVPSFIWNIYETINLTGRKPITKEREGKWKQRKMESSENP